MALTTIAALALCALTARGQGEDVVVGGGRHFVTTATDEVLAEEFNAWLAKHIPAKKLNLRVAPAQGMRFGTFAVRKIKDGQIYNSIPWDLLMGEHTMQRSDRNVYLKLDLHSALLLFLLHEREKGAGSFWSPYINTLPRVYDTPIHWPETWMYLLEGSPVYRSVLEEKERDKGTYTRLKDFLQAHDRELLRVFTFENYRWAASVLDSRTIHIGGKINLVPLLDMINCKHHENTGKIHTTVFDPQANAAVTKALWSFKKGQQVWENYGQANHIYYRYHSFVIENNYYDCVNYDVPRDVETAAQRYITAHKLGVRQRLTFCISEHSLPQDMVMSFAIARMTEADGGTVPQYPVKDIPHRHGYYLLYDKIQVRLNEYPTTLEEDEAFLALDGRFRRGELVGPSVPPEFTLAVRFRALEKRVLLGVKEKCRQFRKQDWFSSTDGDL